MAQQMDRNAILQSASAVSLLDVQTVDTHPLIVSHRMTKAAVAPVFLINSRAICHIELHCLLCNVVITALKRLTLFHFTLCFSVHVFKEEIQTSFLLSRYFL